MNYAIYIAAAYHRQLEARQLAQELGEMGHAIVSRWVFKEELESWPMDADKAAEIAESDLADIAEAEVFILLTEEVLVPRNSRMVEFGFALCHAHYFFVVGPQENIYCYLPTVKWFATSQDLLFEFMKYRND